MWHHVISKDQFKSRISPESDEMGTGKWIVPFPLGDPDDLWERLVKAACHGDIVATKMSSSRLDAIVGHHLACVYCGMSDEASVGQTLTVLQDLGVEGPLRYKADKATVEGREEYLWTSDQIETETTPQP